MGCFLKGFRPDRSELKKRRNLLFLSHLYVSGSGGGQGQAPRRFSVSFCFYAFCLHLCSVFSSPVYCTSCLFRSLSASSSPLSFYPCSSWNLLTLLNFPVCLLCILLPPPILSSRAPELLLGPVGACLNVLSGHGLCLSQGGTMSGIALGHIFSAPHLFQCFLLCFFVILFNFIFYSVPHFCSW